MYNKTEYGVMLLGLLIGLVGIGWTLSQQKPYIVSGTVKEQVTVFSPTPTAVVITTAVPEYKPMRKELLVKWSPTDTNTFWLETQPAKLGECVGDYCQIITESGGLVWVKRTNLIGVFE